MELPCPPYGDERAVFIVAFLLMEKHRDGSDLPKVIEGICIAGGGLKPFTFQPSLLPSLQYLRAMALGSGCLIVKAELSVLRTLSSLSSGGTWHIGNCESGAWPCPSH